jgi:hypothetical protein
MGGFFVEWGRMGRVFSLCLKNRIGGGVLVKRETFYPDLNP